MGCLRASLALLLLMDSHHDASGDAQIVLMIVGSVGEGGQQVFGLYGNERQAIAEAKFYASSGLKGEGGGAAEAGVIGREAAGGVSGAEEKIAEGLDAMEAECRTVADASGEGEVREVVVVRRDASFMGGGEVSEEGEMRTEAVLDLCAAAVHAETITARQYVGAQIGVVGADGERVFLLCGRRARCEEREGDGRYDKSFESEVASNHVVSLATERSA
jgi:hypothetical protein